MSAMAALPDNHPIMQAWRTYSASEEYANTKKWCTRPEHVDGSLWAAFLAGYTNSTVTHDAEWAAVVAALRGALELTEGELFQAGKFIEAMRSDGYLLRDYPRAAEERAALTASVRALALPTPARGEEGT
jgi:hypothetical protein